MRIHEIISEAGILQNLGTGILKGIAKGFGYSAKAEELAPDIAKQMSRLRRALTDDEVIKIVKQGDESVQEALEKALERKIASNPRATMLTQAERDAVITAHPNPDPKLIKQIQEKAKKLADDAEWAAAVKPYKDSWNNTWEWLEILRSWGIAYPVIGMMFLNPLITYRSNMEKAQKLLDSRAATLEDFEAFHRDQMSKLVGRWAAVFAAGSFAKLPAGIVATAISKLGMPGIGKFISRVVGTPMAIAAMGYLSQPDISQAIGNFMAGNVFGQAVGYLGIKTEDQILGMISEKLKYGPQVPTSNNNVNGGQGIKQEPNAAADIGSSSQPPSSNSTTSNTQSNKSEYTRPLFKDFK
jgi:hypothetical protein